MPRSQQQQQASRAVVRRDDQGEATGAQVALAAVTREIDNRLAIIGASSVMGIRPDRLKLVALTAFTRTPALWTCEPVSIARAIVEAGQLGLEPTGLLGGAYLVPRAGKATLLVGYRGLVMLAMRSNLVQRVEARVVRAKDAFDYGYGLEPYLHHTPSQDPDPGEYTGAYAVLFYRDGSRQFDYMSIAEIEAIRGRSSAKDSGPWVTDYAEMCKKTPLRRLMKMAPLTVEVRTFIDENDPEVDASASTTPAAANRQAELRAQLQGALEREYGTGAAAQLGAGPTTQASDGAGTPSAGAAGPAAEGAPAPGAQAEAPQAAPAGAPPSAGAASEPEHVAAIMGIESTAACGVVHEGLGVGPCILPAGHAEGVWRDAAGEHQPQAEHVEKGGTQWTMPRQAAR